MAAVSLEGLDGVVWAGLETSPGAGPVEEVPRALRRLAEAGAGATEDDVDRLLGLWPREGRAPSVAGAALPFVLALAADPAMGARVHLVDLLAGLQHSELADEVRSGARVLAADPDPVIRRAAVRLAGGVPGLLERWRAEVDPAVRVSLLLALGEALAGRDTGPEAAGPDAVGAAQAVLAEVLAGDDPVQWVAALSAAAVLDPGLAARRLDRLVEVFSDPALRPRFEQVWYLHHVPDPYGRDELVPWAARLLAADPAAELSFALRLTAAATRTGDAPLCRAALDVAWHLLTERPSAAAPLPETAAGLLADPDDAVRLRAAHLLAVLGPAAAPYADRLAALLDDTGEDEWFEGTVGEFARWALARIGDPRALPGLVEQLYEPYREQYSRAYCSDDPRRPDIRDVLVPLREHADVLLPAVREALRLVVMTTEFLPVLAAWGEASRPALPELLPLLDDTTTSLGAAEAIAAIGPAAAAAVPALRAATVLDHPGNHCTIAMAVARVTGERAAALRLVGDTLLAEDASNHGVVVHLAAFGREAAPYAGRVRSVMRSEAAWTRCRAAGALWAITGEAEPVLPVLEEAVLEVARGGTWFGLCAEAIRGLIRVGRITPAARDALRTLRDCDRRLSADQGYRAILQDEELRALVAQALALPD